MVKSSAAHSEMHDAACTKLDRILGAEKARLVLAEGMKQCNMASIGTPDDLFRFARVLERQGGIVATIGALLALHAVLRGASGSRV